jgi:hypothetical protein
MHGSGPTYAIYNGTVRDIVHAEAEWNTSGVTNCYNFYSHIVLTLPANATYYTYQLRLIFLNSTDKPRTITDICPIRITASGTFSALTENGTLPSGYPRVNGSGLFYNFSSSYWQHHWSQLNSSQTSGFGIMFTDDANKMLYFFDNETTKRGALKVNSTEKAIELLPVSSGRPSITNHVDPLDICWYGAVVTFDANYTPIYRGGGTNATGLWVLVEYPPIITVTTEN